jgi:hypothetical protein
MPDPSPDDKVEDAPKGEETTTDVKENPAEPSTADKGKEAEPDKGEVDKLKGEPGDMLSAVKAALEPKADKTPKSDEPDPKSEAKTDESKKDEPDEDSDELTEEELARLKPKTKKRIDNLLAERAERDKTIEQIKPKADQFDRVVDFVRDAGLVPNEVNQLFDIGKNLKHNPRAAYDQIKPVYEQLQRMFGDVLPDDLQDQVKKGLITAPNAKALAEARTNAAVAEQQATRMRERQEQDRQAAANTQHVGEVRTKVSEWETSKEKADPDWKLKQPHVMRAIENSLLRRAQTGGSPPTAAEAVEIAEKALTDINAEFKALAPRKREVKSPTDAASSRSTAQPASMLEAARAGLAKAAG